MNGWLFVDKPVGITSTGVINQLKHFGFKKACSKIGHGGTLDPFATGILPIALGKATKLIEYAMDKTKTYEFTITWGEDRDTLDLTGTVTATSPARPYIGELHAIVEEMNSSGPEILQLPPAFSALKINGKRAYTLARCGEKPELAPRKVKLHNLKLLNATTTDATFIVTSGRGFYVRSLARDIAARVKALGYVSKLRRIELGKITITNTISLAFLEEVVYTAETMGLEKALSSYLQPTHVVLDDILVQHVNQHEASKLQCGNTIETDMEENQVAAFYEGSLIAICRADGTFMHPTKVLV
jgi:tRNA pseudouridine55 synthase